MTSVAYSSIVAESRRLDDDNSSVVNLQRRDSYGDSHRAKVIILSLLNQSVTFLSDSRGGGMLGVVEKASG